MATPTSCHISPSRNHIELCVLCVYLRAKDALPWLHNWALPLQFYGWLGLKGGGGCLLPAGQTTELI